MWQITFVELIFATLKHLIMIYTNILFNYFAPIISVVIQMIGYYLQEVDRL